MAIRGQGMVVIGCQWGDEGKGKVVDVLASSMAAVVRYQGGNNAGHTLLIDGRKQILHLLPSGVMAPDCMALIGNGVVVEPSALLDEISSVESYVDGVRDRVRISPSSTLVLPTHIAIDQAREESEISRTLGTTGRGIGPAYEDKIARRGLRIEHLLNVNTFVDKLKQLMDYHNFCLSHLYETAPLDYQAVVDDYLGYREELCPLIADIGELISTTQATGGHVLFEGAQGILLDVDHGSYPFVTSSNTSIGGVFTGSGVNLSHITGVFGVMKAYQTRVGEGAFPTEQRGEVGEYLLKVGHEIGATTGRDRRCGWLDLALMRYAINVTGVQYLCLTKMDIFDNFDPIKLAVGYQHEDYSIIPTDLASAQPIYEELQGWSKPIRGMTEFDALPTQAQHLVARIEALLGIPVVMISTGPGRQETIMRPKMITDNPHLRAVLECCAENLTNTRSDL